MDSRTRLLIIGSVVAVVVTALLVVILRPWALPPNPGDPSPAPTSIAGPGRVSQGFRSAETPGFTSKLSISAPDVTEAEFAGLSTWLSMGALVTAPVRFEIGGEMPASGVRLTRTYAAQLPTGVDASFAYFDQQFGGWRLAESALSADRRTLTADVDHLSDWADIVFGAPDPMKSAREALSAAGATVVDAAAQGLDKAAAFADSAQRAFVEGTEWGYYGVGKVFDVRVDRPQCHGKVPDWVLNAVEPTHDKNNPILFCVGRDPKRKDLIVVKARVNRGFGYFARTVVKPEWILNSTYDQKLFDSTVKIVTELDRSFATKINEITGGGRLVGPGEEISLGFTEEQVRDAIGQPVLVLDLPSPAGFLATVIAAQLVSLGLDYPRSLVTGMLLLSTCVKEIASIRDLFGVGSAAVNCLLAADEAVTQTLTRVLLSDGKRTPKQAAMLAAKIVAKALAALALVGPAFSILNWSAEHTVNELIRAVSVFAKPFRCNATDISRDLGQSATRNVVVCQKNWAITEERDALGDTEQLVHREGRTWRFVTGFPSEYCRDDMREMKVPGAILDWFQPCAKGTRVLTAYPLSLYGRLSAGWRIKDQRQSGLEPDCGSYPSPVASSGGVWQCLGNGNYACWADPRSPSNQVLCGSSLGHDNVLRRMAASLGPSPAPMSASDTTPWRILLADGTRCTARDGGSWSGRPNDDLGGAYSCSTDDFLVVLTDDGVDPIDRSLPTWTVRVGYLEDDPRAADSPRRVKVAKAWYAGAWE